MLKFIYINEKYVVYASAVKPEDNNNLFILEHELDYPEEVEDLINALQTAIDVAMMQMAKELTDNASNKINVAKPNRGLN